MLQSGAQEQVDVLIVFFKIDLSSGISCPAELIVLSSSKCPWEEIFASWRRVGFLGCRISPLWHLASSQTRANINCCVDLQKQSCLEGRVTQLSIRRDSKRCSSSLLRVSRGSGGSSTGASSSSVTTPGPSQPYPNPCCTLKLSEDFHFFLLFILPSDRLCSVSQLQRSC